MLAPTDPAVRAVLRSAMIAEVATLSAKGRPFLTPLWFVVDREALYITTGPGTWAGRNVVVHPEVMLLFDVGSRAAVNHVLRLRGVATCHHGLPGWRVLARIAAKYYLSPAALRVELRNARKWRLRSLYYGQAKGGFGYIRVLPSTAELLPRPSSA
jgi:hypothetical protein